MSFVKLRSEGLSWRQVGDEVVLLDTKSAEYLSVNRTGAFLWPRMVQGCTVTELTEALADHFGVSAEQAATDTDSFLDSLRQLGLLEEEYPTT
jgi:hypothetical protein